jgi:hypothetical protein
MVVLNSLAGNRTQAVYTQNVYNEIWDVQTANNQRECKQTNEQNKNKM